MCQSCEALMINGVHCHEHGCPEAWKDYAVNCFECGCSFKPESQHQDTCEDCYRSMNEFIDQDNSYLV